MFHHTIIIKISRLLITLAMAVESDPAQTRVVWYDQHIVTANPC